MKKESEAALERAQAKATHRLTPTERAIVGFIAAHEGRPCTKEQIAVALGRNTKTVDRLVARLRNDGLLVVEPRWGTNGAQLANVYRLA